MTYTYLHERNSSRFHLTIVRGNQNFVAQFMNIRMNIFISQLLQVMKQICDRNIERGFSIGLYLGSKLVILVDSLIYQDILCHNVLCTSHCVVFKMLPLSWDRFLGRCF